MERQIGRHDNAKLPRNAQDYDVDCLTASGRAAKSTVEVVRTNLEQISPFLLAVLGIGRQS